MSITLSTDGKFVSGTTNVPNNKLKVFTSGAPTTYVLPSAANGAIPTDYYFFLQFINGDTQVATIAAASGETVTGVTASTLANEVLLVTRKAATAWHVISLMADVDA